MAEEKDSELLASFNALANLEKDMDAAERDAQWYRLQKTQTIYSKRQEVVSQIPQFWYLVLVQNDDFADYVDVEDMKYLEVVLDVYVVYEDVDHFSITITFGKDSREDNAIQEQTVTKKFWHVVEDGEDLLHSEAVSVVWPESLANINPTEIKARTRGTSMTKEDKKNYRLGMKSFFSWFSWTGTKPGKEFRNGEELARLIADDLYPYAVKYFTASLEADNEDDDEDVSTLEGEELDISADEEEDEKKRKLETEDAESRKKQK
ncbi:uncharacterized protein KQ657_000682 [Scheffersomyces spartinae]|uniref:Uncharacterized protein n=1 Tax=Scheffersomyces spartinae TaxID=45513 RepID=A0A9P7V9C1_9ASCO|nr:uncharacterized protein KQ657_000682 [Scheffersomyces spartinae]KAG7193609.1 hypothetical protein KQ657_000682 [Scheffersomyces spartinae]